MSRQIRAKWPGLSGLDYQGTISIEVHPRTRDLSGEISTLMEWIG